MKSILSIFMAVVLLLPAALPAKSGRVGATIELGLLGGNAVRGELLSLDNEAIAVRAGQGGGPSVFALSRVTQVRVLRAARGKRSPALGILAGLAAGYALGSALGNSRQPQPGSMGMAFNFLPMVTAPLGAIVGVAMTSTRGKQADLLILFQGQGEEARAAALVRLNAMARKPRGT